MNKLGFEGIKIGDERRAFRVITEQDIESFAQLTGDFNPIHVDEDLALRTVFGGRIAHGMLVAGLISAALSKFPGIVIYKSQTIIFLRPVKAGDSIEAKTEVIEKIDEASALKVRISCQNQQGKEVMNGEAIVKIIEAEVAE